MSDWFIVADLEEIASPVLLIYPARMEENIRRMIAIAGSADGLRLHIKTHKMAEVLRMQMDQGVTKFKCATIAEAEMCARCEAADVLIAYQPVGPNVRRVVELVKAFPQTKFSVIADDADAIGALSGAFSRTDQVLELFLDVDCGQHRTGVAPGSKAVELYRLIATLPGMRPGGLHAYDGHIHDSDPVVRARSCEAAFAPVAALRDELIQECLPVPRVVAGGTPTFPFHAKRDGVECSPGTCVFWDAGYAKNFPDLGFKAAAVVLTRVVSKPVANRLCLDLGHKAIASEMPHPRVAFLNLPDANPVAHNEEHLVVELPGANRVKVGDCVYGVPWHVCPTVALHSEAVVIEGGKATGRWKVIGRERILTI